MSVLFKIIREPPPQLRDKQKWYSTCQFFVSFLNICARSFAFQDFVAKCLVKDIRNRPTAAQMLQHKSLQNACSREALVELVEHSRRAIAELGLRGEDDADDYEDALEGASRPHPNFVADSIASSASNQCVAR
mgnify:FL=1